MKTPSLSVIIYWKMKRRAEKSHRRQVLEKLGRTFLMVLAVLAVLILERLLLYWLISLL